MKEVGFALLGFVVLAEFLYSVAIVEVSGSSKWGVGAVCEVRGLGSSAGLVAW